MDGAFAVDVFKKETGASGLNVAALAKQGLIRRESPGIYRITPDGSQYLEVLRTETSSDPNDRFLYLVDGTSWGMDHRAAKAWAKEHWNDLSPESQRNYRWLFNPDHKRGVRPLPDINDRTDWEGMILREQEEDESHWD